MTFMIIMNLAGSRGVVVPHLLFISSTVHYLNSQCQIICELCRNQYSHTTSLSWHRSWVWSIIPFSKTCLMWLLIIIFIQAIIIMIILLWLYYCMCIQHACNHKWMKHYTDIRTYKLHNNNTNIHIHMCTCTDTHRHTYTDTHTHTQTHTHTDTHHTYIHWPSLSRISICIVDGDTTLQYVIPGSINSTVKLWVPSKTSSSIFVIVTHFCVPIWEPAR